jgi:hypothetical protein
MCVSKTGFSLRLSFSVSSGASAVSRALRRSGTSPLISCSHSPPLKELSDPPDGLETFGALVPHAQRDIIPGQLVLPRIEVNRYQTFFFQRLSTQSTRGPQLPEVLRSYFEFQFDLITHLSASPICPLLNDTDFTGTRKSPACYRADLRNRN